MSVTFIQRLLSFSVAAFAALSTFFGAAPGDLYEKGSFPEIGIEDRAEDALRVMSFNIRCASVNDVPMTCRRGLVPLLILRADADSVGVQEATGAWRRVLRLFLPNYGSVGTDREGDGSGESCTILYNKSRWNCTDSGTFWLSETPQTPSKGWEAACKRVCTWAVLQNKRTGESYVHVNSHYDHVSEAARREEAKLVCNFIEEKFPQMPVVFTADMNSRESSVAYAQMSEILQDARYNAPDSLGGGTFHGGNPAGSPKVIDYIFYRGMAPTAFRVVTEGIQNRSVSDHFPLYADFVPAAETAS